MFQRNRYIIVVSGVFNSFTAADFEDLWSVLMEKFREKFSKTGNSISILYSRLTGYLPAEI